MIFQLFDCHKFQNILKLSVLFFFFYAHSRFFSISSFFSSTCSNFLGIENLLLNVAFTFPCQSKLSFCPESLFSSVTFFLTLFVVILLLLSLLLEVLVASDSKERVDSVDIETVCSAAVKLTVVGKQDSNQSYDFLLLRTRLPPSFSCAPLNWSRHLASRYVPRFHVYHLLTSSCMII